MLNFGNFTLPTIPLIHLTDIAQPYFPRCNTDLECQKIIHEHLDSAIPVNCSIKSACQEWIENNVYQLNKEHPSCSLNGRVTVNSKIIGTKPFQNFVRNNQPKMSIDQKGISDLVHNVQNATYSYSVLSNEKLPYEALSALASGKLTLSETANLLIWHRLIVDYSQFELEILPLFDSLGNLTYEANMFLINEFMVGKNQNFGKFVAEIRTLSKSQQVWKRFKYSGGRWAFKKELSLDAKKVFYKNNYDLSFNAELVMGIITKKEIVDGEAYDRVRYCNIPFPEILGEEGDSSFQNPSELSGHDFEHVSIIFERYSPQFLEAVLDIMAHLRKVHNFPISKEIWVLGDLDFPSTEGSPSEEFDFMLTIMNAIKRTSPLWEWFIVIHLRSLDEEQTPLKLDHISYLSEKNALAELSEPILKEYSFLEQIYYLQKFTELRLKTPQEFKDFLSKQVRTPNLTIAIDPITKLLQLEHSK